MPMVDDPLDFGRIEASVALSDIYAMGGTPIMALAILGMPVDKTLPGPCAQNPLDPEDLRELISGYQKCVAETLVTLAASWRSTWVMA
jgi:selenide,water dikinase